MTYEEELEYNRLNPGTPDEEVSEIGDGGLMQSVMEELVLLVILV